MSNGAKVQVVANSPSRLQVLLQIPSITLNPKDSLTIAPSMFVSAGAFDGMTVTNDLFNTARLRFEVPPGTTLQTNSTVPLNGVVTVVPLPGTAGLFGTNMTGLVAWMRRRNRA